MIRLTIDLGIPGKFPLWLAVPSIAAVARSGHLVLGGGAARGAAPGLGVRLPSRSRSQLPGAP